MLQCYKCKYFQIRYSDKINKYGCKALGFKAPDANWRWLHMPCPYFTENPKRSTTINKAPINQNISSKKTKTNINIVI